MKRPAHGGARCTRRRLASCYLGVAGAFSAASPVDAQCKPSTFLEIPVPGVTTFYYDERPDFDPYDPTPEVWFYEEANAMTGLQRGGAQWLLDMLGQGDLDREICNESENPDKLWY